MNDYNTFIQAYKLPKALSKPSAHVWVSKKTFFMLKSRGPQPLGLGPILVRSLCLNYARTAPVRGKTVFHETGPWCQERLGTAAQKRSHFPVYVPDHFYHADCSTGEKREGKNLYGPE